MTKLIILLFTTVLLNACALNQFTGQTDIVPVNSVYGSIAFKGEVERTITSDKVYFTVKNLELTFISDATFNSVEAANLDRLRLYASAMLKNGNTIAIYETSYPINVNLDAENPTATIKDIQFNMPLARYEQSNHIGLSVIDYLANTGVMWPLRTELNGDPINN